MKITVDIDYFPGNGSIKAIEGLKKLGRVRIVKAQRGSKTMTFKRNYSMEYVQECVCEEKKITPFQMNLNSRKREIVLPRQMAMFFSRKYTKESLYNIGSFYGDKDHATVLAAIKAINNLSETNREFRKELSELEEIITGE